MCIRDRFIAFVASPDGQKIISGYGRDGPWADKGGFDLIAQGVSGLMSITGEPDAAPCLSRADVALYRGKQAGRDRVVAL